MGKKLLSICSTGILYGMGAIVLLSPILGGLLVAASMFAYVNDNMRWSEGEAHGVAIITFLAHTIAWAVLCK